MQVHQTKKSNKWQCKLCGEKQSIKRHYGLGTGKECRLHVQKLNSARGEVDETNEIAKLNESSDEELPQIDETDIGKNEVDLKSKWSEFVDNTENVKEPEPDTMCFDNAEVVLEIPTKRRKFTNKAKTTKSDSVQMTYPNKTADSLRNIHQLAVPQMYNVKNKPIVNIVQTNEDQLNDNIPKECIKTTKAIAETFVPHKIDKNSKWAQFADELDEEHYTGNGNSTATDDTALPEVSPVVDDEDLESCKDVETVRNEDVEKVPNDDIPKNIFSLCNESDIDDVLDF